MHVAQQLPDARFDVSIDGTQVDRSAVLPGWSQDDRFGIVVADSLGAVGASLLLQLAIAEFYRVRPERRSSTPMYPEIYLFHVGGPHGDFSNFDFWPPRKEVFLPSGSPLAVLEAINDRAVTRLAIPDGGVGDVSALRAGSNTWAEEASARECLRSCFVYEPSGQISEGDVEISSDDPRVRDNVTATFHPVRGAQVFRSELLKSSAPALPWPKQPEDVFRWADRVEDRVDEVAGAVRDRLAAEYDRRLAEQGGRVIETYRRITVDEALRRIAGLG